MTMGLAGGSAPSTPEDQRLAMARTDSGGRKSPRRTLVQARVSAKELAAWRSKAASAGVSSSALLRQAMARAVVWVPSADEAERGRLRREAERARTREVARIGNNLNQLARWANRHKASAAAERVLARLLDVERALRALAPSGPPTA